MSGVWTDQVLNENVAPKFRDFTTAAIPDLRSEFPLVEHWFTDYFLNTVLGQRFKAGHHQLALGIIRRAQNAFLAFHDARERTALFLSSTTLFKPETRLYFNAVDRWESFVLQVAMAIDLLVAFGDGTPVFTKKDGSREERLYTMANQLKHHASCIASAQAPPDHTVPLWLSNEGLNSFDCLVTYYDAAGVLRELANAAETLKDPRGVRTTRAQPNADASHELRQE